MNTNDLETFYGSIASAARAINLSRQGVAYWQKVGIPPLRQLQFQRLTEGKLKADPRVVRDYLPVD